MRTGTRTGAGSDRADRAIELHSIREMTAYLDSCGNDDQVIVTIEGPEGGDDHAGEED